MASVLANDHQLTLDWLVSLGVVQESAADKFTVTTQVKLAPIEGRHDAGSRPDMMIRIRNGERQEIVFVESKVGSREGRGQLSKYRDHLLAVQGVDRCSLIFITRDYEPKGNFPDEGVKFVQTRWADFYRFLANRNSRSDTIRELLQFMKENNMSQSNRFTVIDLVALTNHSHARSLMEATMGEDIATLFQKQTGVSYSTLDRLKQLRGNKYTMEAYFPTGNDQICYELGYWFPDEQPSESPTVGMRIFVKLKGANYPAIVGAMLAFSKANKVWEHRSTDEEWEEIACTRKLEEFLATEDHVKEIVGWFTALLEDAASFRQQNPSLPWAVH